MIFIPYNVPSSKNSKVKGKFFSKTVKNYLRKHGIQHFSSSRKVVERYKTIPMTFPIDEIKNLLDGLNYPLILGFHFVRDSRRKFDFHNSCQIISDLLTAFDVIKDDDMDHFLPMPMQINGKWYSIDKENSGVYIENLNYE